MSDEENEISSEGEEEGEEESEDDLDSLSTAEYLARRYLVHRRFTRGLPEEASELKEVCEHPLTFTDGMSFSIACLLSETEFEDEEEREARFPLEQWELIAIGKRCLRYTGQLNGAKLPVTFEVVELRHGPPSEEDKARLSALSKNAPGLAKVAIRCFSLDLDSGEVWNTGWFKGALLSGTSFFKESLSEPRALIPPKQAVAPPDRKPLLTFGLLGVLTLCFLGELTFGLLPSEGFLQPHIATLIALGGMFRPLVAEEGQLWRFFTPAFLHGDLMHLFFNGIALAMAGWVLERVFGRAWFLGLFAIGALGGSLASYLFNAENLVSVGASGAIMALFASAMIAAQRLPSGADRTQIQLQLARVLVPSLIPIVTTTSAGQIDFAAHIGGAIVGGIAGGALYLTWSKEEAEPPAQKAAWALAGLYGLGLLWGLSGILVGYQEQREAANAPSFVDQLIPDQELNEQGSEEPARAATLQRNLDRYLREYPRDPRTQYFEGLRAYDRRDLVRAEAAFRRGMAEREILDAHFPSGDLERGLRSMLVSVLLEQGRREEAAEEARPLCGTSDPQLAGFLAEQQLCAP